MMNVVLGEGGNREGQEGWLLFGEAQEAAKELEKLMQQFGDAQSLQAELAPLSPTTRL